MSATDLNHRNVSIKLNLKPTMEVMCGHFLRLIEEVKPLFVDGGELAKKVQKRWYGKQLTDGTYTYGYIWFTVTNRDIMKREFDLNDVNSKVNDLEFTFHVKQNETPITAVNFTSGSLRYKARWGDFNLNRVELNLYGGTDVESAVLFRDMIAMAGPQLAAFSINDTNLIAQNELELLAVRTDY